MPYLTTNGIQTYYEIDAGPNGAGPPLVLLHGFTGSLAQWAQARPMLAAHYRVIAYDLRGHGRSDAPESLDTYTIAAYAADLRDLLDTLSVARAHICGSSFGGMVALEFAFRHPERLASLILADTSAGPRCTELSELIAAREDDISRRVAEAAHTEGAVATLEGRTITRAGFAGAGKARNERPDHHEDLDKLTMPVLIVAGDRDVLVPEAEYMGAHIPGSAVRLINHAGHPAVQDQPHGFVAVVRGFLAGLDPEHQRRTAAY